MRGSIGQILIQQGAIDSAALADALARQSGQHPIASQLYTLGYASERQLATALATQTGWPAIVLDESTISLDVLHHVSLEWARIFSALIIYEDDETIIVAASRPEDAIVPARELADGLGKQFEMRIALDITLARTIRVAFRKLRDGERVLAGSESDRLAIQLATVSSGASEDEHRRAQRAIAEEAARAIERDEDMPSELISSRSGEWRGTTTTSAAESEDDAERTEVVAAQFDASEANAPAHSGTHALVIDPDPPGRIQMVSELERLGYQCQAASTGQQAIDLLSNYTFDLVFADVATSGLDGIRMCRAIKRSSRLRHARVVITTSVVDSGQVPDDVLQSIGADGYLEKPLEVRRLHRLLRDVSPVERSDHENVLSEALERYHSGDLEGAIARLRGALVGDPMSPKLHFMLANMLQRAARYGEAVDEYEAVVDLQPSYFPALTRLAYLYFRQGLHARAVETWRRALPVCDDPALRRNIELFMRKLVADMRSDG